MRRKFAVVTSLLITLLLSAGGSSMAQVPSRTTDRQVQQTLNSLERRTDAFRNSLDTGFDRSRYNGTKTEDQITRYVQDFEQATDRLQEKFRNRNAVSSDVDEVLSRGWYIDSFMRNNSLGPVAERNWRSVRTDLQTLARQYNVQWRWDDRSYNPTRYSYGYNTRLTGTYTLDTARSDNIQRAVENATRGLNRQEADRVQNALLRRMESPEQIAIQQNGQQLTFVSTNAPQVTITADGRGQTETRQNGRSVTTTSTLNNDQLTINSTGDRVNDFSVVFEPIGSGRSLRVTKRLYSDRLSQPVQVISVYNRTSDTAQLNIYNGNYNNRRNARYNRSGTDGRNRNNSNGNNGQFLIADGTVLNATLNENLSTERARQGDRFTLTVNSPSRYRGAVIEGYILENDRAGKVTGRSELTMEFERIRWNGRSYEFGGFIESVRTPDGDDVKLDNEGTIGEDDSQTERTVTRTGIGAAIGAIIGGITGGGKGAAIGAAIGAGAGAGTVLIQGRDDLNLSSGTEFTIRASAP